MSYEIGYRKPPASGKFKKGSSGNPKGRPKGSKNFITLLEKELAQPIIVTENGKKKKLSRMQAMVKRLVAGAMQGDVKQLMSLIEVLRKTGSFDRTDASESLVPEDYEAILDAYVETRSSKSKEDHG
jgi:Family of unknown function (DUF5681)